MAAVMPLDQPPETGVPALRPADAIFVLAGRKSRKPFALKLFGSRLAPALILSVGRFEVRHYASLGLPRSDELRHMARSRPPSQRHFFMIFRGGEVEILPVRVGLPGTLTEIAQLRDWLAKHREVKSLLMVSSAFHLRRVALCCETLIPWCSFQYAASPETAGSFSFRRNLREAWLRTAEHGKRLAYRLLLSKKSSQARS